ncbi:MAG: hypothetical protein EPN97_16810 [Alphaproteobacteria bacterium]|nr:MAG: hypothetical protein EPN97_16810 [Alphaproteobacteria bacterium]
MTENYWEHASYGKENRDDKSITLTFGKPLTDAQWNDMDGSEPQLDSGFDDLDYCDGDGSPARLSHDWEKTDTCPRGLTGYSLSRTELKIWASEAIEPRYFMDVARHVIAAAAKTPGLGAAEVAKVSTSGIAVGYAGTSLDEVAATIDIAGRSFKAKPKTAPKGP